MKRLALLLLPTVCGFVLLVAQEKSSTPPAQDDDAEVNLPDTVATKAIGIYTGKLGDLNMSLSLDKIVGQTMMGYSIVEDNERAFSGAWTQADGGIRIVAKEPGDHPFDGVFELAFQQGSNRLVGEWTPYDKKLAPAKLELARKEFKYNPKLGKYPQSSTRLLKEKDVENMRPSELRIMRSEIYARHGYCFRLADMRDHFNETDWYIPVSVDIVARLTDIEKKNEALIKRYEKYGEEYYDGFGR
ncbi:MAG TPA: YARHG domain-containing protein [Bacteroidia bacterium]|nr:YARHG domain-containing protein [Bacteroidia bacterium]